MKITSEIISAMRKAGACTERIAWYEAAERDSKDAARDDLRWVISSAPEEYKALAAAALLADKPSHYDLLWVIYYAPEEYKALAWTALLANKPTLDDLRYIINSAPEKYKALARKELK